MPGQKKITYTQTKCANLLQFLDFSFNFRITFLIALRLKLFAALQNGKGSGDPVGLMLNVACFISSFGRKEARSWYASQ